MKSGKYWQALKLGNESVIAQVGFPIEKFEKINYFHGEKHSISLQNATYYQGRTYGELFPRSPVPARQDETISNSWCFCPCNIL